MLKRYGTIGITTLLLALPFQISTAGAADMTKQELQQEIMMLKNIVLDLNDRLVSAEEMLQLSLEQQQQQTAATPQSAGPDDETLDMLDELDERVTSNEKHATLDKLTLGVELETKANSIHMDVKTMAASNQIMISQMALAGSTFTPMEMAGFRQMMSQQGSENQKISNDVIWTTRMRLDMKSRPTKSLGFVGRLSANKVFGDSTGVKWYNGGPNAVTMDGNVSSTGSDSALRIERAFFTYFGEMGEVPYHFSLGRRPALGGAPAEFSTASMVGGSPMAHGVNWQFDGASLGWNLSEPAGVPGMDFKICWGFGFESGVGSGNSYSMSYNPDITDSQFGGWIFKIYEDENTKVSNMYAHAFDITDGFTGLAVMPFTITGSDFNGDGQYDSYQMNANTGGYISRTEPTANIGSLDIVTLLAESKFNDIGFFVDLAYSHAKPSGVSNNPMLQFLGTDALLNSNGGQEARNGYSVWAGLKTQIPGDGTIGFEYNWGSEYWIAFTGGEDNIAGSKLATRGSVYEIFYNQPFVDNKLVLSLGAQYYDYDYTGSGNPMGAPVDIDNVSALDTFMPVTEKMWNYYANLIYRW